MATKKESKKVEDNHNLVTYTVEQAASFLRSILKMPSLLAPSQLWIGEVGIGKTSAIESVVKDMHGDDHLIVRHLSQVHPLDLGGIGIDPAKREMYFAKPPLVQELEQMPKPRVLFLDEIDRVQPIAQSALLQLLLGKVHNGFPLEDTYVVGAGNSWYAEYTFELDKAMASRPAIIHITTNSDDWLKWAARNGVHSSVLTTIAMAADVLNQHGELSEACMKVADPRAWATFSTALNAGVDSAHAAAFVGEHAARIYQRYLSFAKDYHDEIKAVCQGKSLDPAKLEGGETTMFGIYIAAGSQVTLAQCEKFLENSAEQVGHERTYVIGRLPFNRFGQEMLDNPAVKKLREKLLAAYKDDVAE